VFVEQLEVARTAGKPVVIHTREAWPDTLELLEKHWRGCGLPGVMHCFSGGPEEARRSLDLGFYISFAGVVTFPKALEIQEAARVVPGDKLLVETDAPFLAPVPYRGKRNEPGFVVHTLEAVARLRDVSLQEAASVSLLNAESVFHLS
jgi:TatD DNase family protein